MSDEFDDIMRDGERHMQRQSAERDAELSVLRRIWEECSHDQKNELVTLLHTLEIVTRRVWTVTRFRLNVGNIASSLHDEMLDEHMNELDREMKRMKKEIFIVPAEFLCAIACWSHGEEYTPDKCIGKWSDHPRWPYTKYWGIEYPPKRE